MIEFTHEPFDHPARTAARSAHQSRQSRCRDHVEKPSRRCRYRRNASLMNDAARPLISEGLPDSMPPEIAALRESTEPVSIFAYGSLMWDPDFPRLESEPALLRGYHRSFCLY